MAEEEPRPDAAVYVDVAPTQLAADVYSPEAFAAATSQFATDETLRNVAAVQKETPQPPRQAVPRPSATVDVRGQWFLLGALSAAAVIFCVLYLKK